MTVYTSKQINQEHMAICQSGFLPILELYFTFLQPIWNDVFRLLNLQYLRSFRGALPPWAPHQGIALDPPGALAAPWTPSLSFQYFHFFVLSPMCKCISIHNYLRHWNEADDLVGLIPK